MCESDRPIGIFDSGVGGLTVFAQVSARRPQESILYLGDTARVPYGTKSHDTVRRYARACAAMLTERGVKLLVVACNTASAYALETLRDELALPVVGVVEPGAREAVAKTQSGRIGVIGTAGTIGSGAYQEAVLGLAPKAEIYCKPCPLFVPLAEEGWLTGEVPERVAAQYLEELLEEKIDTLVLGCTHYPLLREVIAETAGSEVALVDSAEATSQVVAETLDAMDMASSADESVEHRFLVTDAPDSFAHVGKRFLGRDIEHVDWVDFQ